MSQSDWSHIRKVCTELADSLKEVLSWSWDDRFECALAAFSAQEGGNVGALLKRLFDSSWDDSTIEDAPQRARLVSNDLGGLRSGQQIFVGDLDRDAFLIGAWWPWGDGKTISIRIIPYGMGLPDELYNEFVAVFKKCFRF